MNNCSVKGETKVLGINLAKQSFQLHGVDNTGKTLLLKKLSRNKLSAFIANLPPCLIGLEACGGAHHWVRVFKVFGHTVKMIAPQCVKPYVKSNKNDAVDAEAICEAVQRPSMRFVPEKTIEQQDMQSLYPQPTRGTANCAKQSNTRVIIRVRHSHS